MRKSLLFLALGAMFVVLILSFNRPVLAAAANSLASPTLLGEGNVWTIIVAFSLCSIAVVFLFFFVRPPPPRTSARGTSDDFYIMDARDQGQLSEKRSLLSGTRLKTA